MLEKSVASFSRKQMAYDFALKKENDFTGIFANCKARKPLKISQIRVFRPNS